MLVRLTARPHILEGCFQVRCSAGISSSSPFTARFLIRGPRPVVPSEDYSLRAALMRGLLRVKGEKAETQQAEQKYK